MLNVECAAMIAGCVFRRVQICLDCEGGVGGREKEAASAATGKLKKKKKYKPPDLTLHTIALDLENSNQMFE